MVIKSQNLIKNMVKGFKMKKPQVKIKFSNINNLNHKDKLICAKFVFQQKKIQ